MGIPEFYKWEAVLADGSIVNQGGDLTKAVKFSLIPVHGHLPRHDLVGIPMIRRFGRGFKKVRFNNYEVLPGRLLWEDGSNIVKTYEDLSGVIDQGQLVRRRNGDDPWIMVSEVHPSHLVLAKPFHGVTKALPSLVMTLRADEEYLHVVVCEGFRYYVRSSDGTALITPQDYELYL